MSSGSFATSTPGRSTPSTRARPPPAASGPGEAIPIYRKALETEPNHGLSRYFLGQAYLSTGRLAEALAELGRANDAMGQAPFVRAGLAMRSPGQDGGPRPRRSSRSSPPRDGRGTTRPSPSRR